MRGWKVGICAGAEFESAGCKPRRVAVPPEPLCRRQRAPDRSIPAVHKLFGARYLVSVEVRLYLDGQYQTQTFGQVATQGGDRDPELANFVMQQTENLLGLNSAYRSIDMGPAPKNNAPAPHTQ